MQTIKIKLDIINVSNGEGDVSVSELRRVIKENPELLTEEKLPFVERMIEKEYWYMSDSGEKILETYTGEYEDVDRLSINNVFFTESDCDKEIAKRKALGNIMSYIRDNEIELVKDEDYSNREIEKHCISGWNYDEDKVNEDVWCFVDWSKFSLAFYSREDREKVIENCKEDLTTLLKK